MATYTFTTNANQDAVLARILTRANAERVAGGQSPFADVQAYLTSVLVSAVQSWMRQARESERADAETAWNGLSAAQKTTIRNLLGGNDPF